MFTPVTVILLWCFDFADQVTVTEIWKAEKALEFEKAHLLFAEGMRNFTAEAVLDWIDSHYCLREDCTFYDLGRCKD